MYATALKTKTKNKSFRGHVPPAKGVCDSRAVSRRTAFTCYPKDTCTQSRLKQLPHWPLDRQAGRNNIYLVWKFSLRKIQDTRFLLQLMLFIQEREQNALPVRFSLVHRDVAIPLSDGFRQASGNVRFFGDLDNRLEVRPYREHECLGPRKPPQALPLRSEVQLFQFQLFTVSCRPCWMIRQ
jgi:hypothetical protein